MYAILISAALAIYSIILVDFSVLYKEISVNNDLLTSTQALYAAEGAIENTVGLIGKNDVTVSNIKFMDAADSLEAETVSFLEYNEGADSFYIQKQLALNEPSLDSAEATHENNRVTYSKAYLTDGQALDQKAYYGLEPRKSKGFVIREVDPANNFNEIWFDFNQGLEESELLFDIFVFPKESSGAEDTIEFADFKKLEESPENNPIKRVSINTRNQFDLGSVFGGGSQLLPKADLQDLNGAYKKRLTISSLNPISNNYIFYFQTLDNEPVHFKLQANGGSVSLPNMMQTIDVIGVTPTGLYSRIKYQRQSEEGIAPGLNFVHFTRQSLIK